MPGERDAAARPGSAILARAVAAALAVAIGFVSHDALAQCRQKSIDIPVTIIDSRPIAMVSMDGVQVPLLVDTGAYYSVLTEAAAAQLHLSVVDLPPGLQIFHGATGPMPVRLSKVQTLGLGNATLPNVGFLVGLNEVGGGAMGVLGGNILTPTDSEFDLANGMIRLVTSSRECTQAELTAWAGKDATVNVIALDTRLQRALQTNVFNVDMRVNGEKVSALMDTGAPGTDVALGAAGRLGVDEASMTPDNPMMGGGSGYARSWLAPVEALDIGGEHLAHQTLRIVDESDDQHGALLGLDYFLSHHLYVSRWRDKVYATSNGGAVFSYATPDDSVVADADAAPLDADALVRRGAASAARKAWRRALADLDRACAMTPPSASCFLARARVHVAMKNRAAALKDLDEALRLDAGRTDARMERATARAESDDRDGAVADLEALAAAVPPQSNLHRPMAEAWATLDRLPEALAQWAAWSAAHPHDAHGAQVLDDRCRLRMKLARDLDLALADCRAAIAANPVAGRFRDSLGWVWLRRGDLAQALQAFDEALAADPKLAWSHYGRAVVLQRKGDDAAAAAELALARATMADIDEQARRHGMQAP